MLARARSVALIGVDAVPVEVEVDVSPGLPAFKKPRPVSLIMFPIPSPPYNYAMNKRVLIRFVPPAPIKVAVSKGISRTRNWNAPKLVGFLQEGLEIWAADAYPELELAVVESRQAEIRFDGWKPDKELAAEMREAIGQQMGLVLEGIEPNEYLSE